MARDLPAVLSSARPLMVAPGRIHIGHVQLRDLILCPRDRGVLNYVDRWSILEHDTTVLDSPPRKLVDLAFVPNTLAALPLAASDTTLFAAGGLDKQLHLSLHAPRLRGGAPRAPLWQFEASLCGTINNSVLLTSLSLTRAPESSVEPRVGISNNDHTVKFYDIPLRTTSPPKTIKEVGTLQLDVPVNHSSISPDGRTLLSVGDSPKVYLHHLTGGARVAFLPITTLTLPPPENTPMYWPSTLAASFSTAFSANGTKFAVASQEGVVAVWDVRSSKPLKVFHTDKTRMPTGRGASANGGATGWLSDDPFEWSQGLSKPPGWSVRSVKFGGTGGHETMVFTEHTSLLHVVDAMTFETEEIVRVPSSTVRSPPLYPSHPPLHTTARSPPRPVPAPRTSPPPAPPPPMIVLALEDTFRIPASPRAGDAAVHWRALHMRRPEDDVVVIPPLGDRDVEHDVAALLGRHGIRARQHGDGGGGAREEWEYALAGRRAREDEMELDEPEADCVSSHTPSRASSPAPGARARHPRRRAREDAGAGEGAGEGEGTDADLDLAGVCFDPSGRFVYVGSTDGVAEWSVRGAEKRWWHDAAWV